MVYYFPNKRFFNGPVQELNLLPSSADASSKERSLLYRHDIHLPTQVALGFFI